MDSIFKVTNKGGGRGEILMYTDIGGWFGITALEFANQVRDLGNVSHVDLRVISEGGSVIEAIGMYNTIRAHPARWTAHIDGLAASAASWLVLAANHVNMAENAQFMIHRGKSPAFGDADDLRQMADLIEDIEKTAIVNAYMSKTGMDHDAIMDMMKAETWMNADKAKGYGFVDEITETIQMAASAQLSGRYAYAHAPESLMENHQDKAPTVTPLLQAAKMREMEMKTL